MFSKITRWEKETWLFFCLNFYLFILCASRLIALYHITITCKCLFVQFILMKTVLSKTTNYSWYMITHLHANSGVTQNWWYYLGDCAIKELFVVCRLWSPLREVKYLDVYLICAFKKEKCISKTWRDKQWIGIYIGAYPNGPIHLCLPVFGHKWPYLRTIQPNMVSLTGLHFNLMLFVSFLIIQLSLI